MYCSMAILTYISKVARSIYAETRSSWQCQLSFDHFLIKILCRGLVKQTAQLSTICATINGTVCVNSFRWFENTRMLLKQSRITYVKYLPRLEDRRTWDKLNFPDGATTCQNHRKKKTFKIIRMIMKTKVHTYISFQKRFVLCGSNK